MSFVLKVIDNEEMGILYSDDRHRLGGTDLVQGAAFQHLFPKGECHVSDEEVLHRLAHLHGWMVVIESVKGDG